jgi:hypothetical protein
MVVVCTTGIEPALTTRADIIARKVLGDRKLLTARSAQYGAGMAFIGWPYRGSMTGRFAVTFDARKPVATAFEPDRNDIEIGIVMGAACLWIHIDTTNVLAMYRRHHVTCRGVNGSY